MFSKPLSYIELALNRAIRDLDRHEVGSEEYAKRLDIVSKLHKMKEEEKTPSVSRDTMVIVGANLLGIFMILNAEYAHVLSARALNLVMKPRV